MLNLSNASLYACVSLLLFSNKNGFSGLIAVCVSDESNSLDDIIELNVMH